MDIKGEKCARRPEDRAHKRKTSDVQRHRPAKDKHSRRADPDAGLGGELKKHRRNARADRGDTRASREAPGVRPAPRGPAAGLGAPCPARPAPLSPPPAPRAPGSPPGPPARHFPALTREPPSHQWGSGAAGPCPSPRKVCPGFPHLKLPRRGRSLPPGRAGRGGPRVGRSGRPGLRGGRPAGAWDPEGTLGPRQHVTLPRWVPSSLAARGSGRAAVEPRRR